MNQELLRRLSAITEEEHLLQDSGEINRSLYPAVGDFVIDPDRLPAHRLDDISQQVALRTHTRFTEFPVHGHNYIEVMYVCSGSVTHIIGPDRITLVAGDLLFLNMHTRHRVLAAGAGDVAVNLILTVDFFASFLDFLRESDTLYEFAIENLRKDGQPGYLHYNISDILPITNLMENLVWSLVAEKTTPPSVFRQTVGLLLNYLARSPAALCDKAQPTERNTAMLRRITAYVDTCYATASLHDLAKQLGFSEQYLSEWIRIHLGAGFRSVLQEKRFSVAEQLLVTTNLSVGEIMATVGYENSSYFHRCFRQRYGVSPLVYRNRAAHTAES